MSFIVTPSTPAAPTVPGGADTQIQFNDAGVFGGSADMTYDAGTSITKFKEIQNTSGVFPITGNSGLNLLSGPNSDVFIQGGESSTGSGAGNVSLYGGTGLSTGGGGNVNVIAGDNGSTGFPGDVIITAGSNYGSPNAGNVKISAGFNSGVTQFGRAQLLSPTSIPVVSVGGYASGLLGFYGATEITRPTTSVAAATFVVGAGVAVQDVSTFDGYTIAKVVKALRNLGLLT